MGYNPDDDNEDTFSVDPDWDAVDDDELPKQYASDE